MPPNGGCGSYSMLSWTSRAVDSSVSRATSAKAMSIPADTPADVMNFHAHPPLRQVGGAQALEQSVVGPVGRGIAVFQQAGGGQDEGTGADRPHHRHRLRGVA